MKKKALIVGYTGQDGTILTDFLKKDNYEIIGLSRNKIFCHSDIQINKPVNINVFDQVSKLIEDYLPDEIFYLASYHHSSEDHTPDEYDKFIKSIQVNTIDLFNFLEAIRRYCPSAKLFYAASSHIFGIPDNEIQNESTPINPICFYGISKSSGLFLCRYYRNEHNIFASTAILYNHESKYRKSKFLSKKIINGAIEIKKGNLDSISLGDLESVVDWGYAPDYVKAMRLIIQADKADDYIVASGQKHSVKEFVEKTFSKLDLNWKKYIKVNPNIIQKTKRILVGDISKITKKIGWKPSISFDMLIDRLIKDQGILKSEK